MSLIALIVTLVIVGLVFYLLWWLVGYIGLPEPFNKVIQVLIALVAVIYLLSVLTGMAPVIPLHNLRVT